MVIMVIILISITNDNNDLLSNVISLSLYGDIRENSVLGVFQRVFMNMAPFCIGVVIVGVVTLIQEMRWYVVVVVLVVVLVVVVVVLLRLTAPPQHGRGHLRASFS